MASLLEAPPYLFNSDFIGLMQVAAIVGFLLACYGGGYLSDVISSIIVQRSSDIAIRPEQRLVSLLPGMLIGPAGSILLAFACGNQLHWSAIAVGFGMVSFGEVYTPNIAITYIVQLHQKDAAKSLVLVNIFKNLLTFAFLYVAADWARKEGYIQVFMIMFMLNALTLLCALPLYIYGRRKGAERGNITG